jgi:tripartite-type tricarboxylate transporter receptor subunit TctC
MKMLQPLLAAALLAASFAAHGADAPYPSRPVRMFVPFAPGGPTDVIARLIAQKLTEAWSHQVVVDNRAGAGGNIGMGLAATSPPDGYTILVVSSSFVVNPTLYVKIPYDPYKSFIPITNAAASPNVFTVHPSVSANTMQELVALAKANPRKFNAATPGVGTTPDLGVELLKMTAHIDLVRVPYGGAGPAVAAVMGNQVQVGSTALPDVPTMAEAGLKGQEADTLQGILVPAGTAKSIVTRVHDDVVRALAQPEVRERVATLGFDVVASTPEQFAAQINAEIAKWGKVIKAAGLKAD